MCSLVSAEVLTLIQRWTDKSPVGTWTYDSKVSGQQEQLPVAASLMSAAGLDYELITFAREFLEKSEMPDAVKTGRHMFRPASSVHRPDSTGTAVNQCAKE